MNKHNSLSILNIFFLITHVLSSGCGAVTAVPIPSLHPTPLQEPTPSPTNTPEQILIKGILIYSDFENIYAVDLQNQTTKVVYRSDFSVPQYFTANNTLYIALPTTQNEEGTWRHQLFELGIDGNIGEQLTFVDDMSQAVGFNDKVDYLTYLSEKRSLILLDVKNKRIQVIAEHDPNIAFEYIFPISWSPDNKRLLYGRFSMPDSSTSPCSLFVFDIEDNKSIELFPGKTSDMLAKWSPDGKNIALRIESNNQSNVYIFNTENETLKQIPVNETYSYFEGLSWSSDGEKLIFSTGKAVYLLNLLNDKLEVIAQYSDIAIGFVASPDKNMVLYEQSNRTANNNLYLFDINKKTTVKASTQNSIPAGVDIFSWNYSSIWSPDGKFFVYFTPYDSIDFDAHPTLILNIQNIKTGGISSFEVPTTHGSEFYKNPYWLYSNK